MYSVNCPECNQCFSRRDAMLRHKHYKHDGQNNNDAHSQISDTYLPSPPGLTRVTLPPPPPPPPQKGHMPSVQYSGIFTQGDAATTTETKPVVLQHPFTMMISGPTGNFRSFVQEMIFPEI